MKFFGQEYDSKVGDWHIILVHMVAVFLGFEVGPD
jgi:hypothetical protein